MRFLLVTQGRSGTHMLRGVFLSHPDVQNFVDYQGKLQGIPGALPEFLAKEYRKADPGSITGAFTHFGEMYERSHREPKGWVGKDWRTLRSMHDRIITLTRPNSLRRFLSTQLLNLRGEQDWASDHVRSEVPALIQLNLQQYREWVLKEQKIVDAILPFLRPYHAITYDQLVDNWVSTLGSIYTYLELTWNDPIVSTFRQETRAIDQIVDWEHLTEPQRQFLLIEDQKGL